MEDALKGWQRTQIIIQCFAEGVLGDEEDGKPVGVTAYVHSDFPGLAVALLPVPYGATDDPVDPPGGYARWTITHLQSGRMAGLWWWCFHNAILAVMSYCRGIAWTQPYEVLRGKVVAVSDLLRAAADNEIRPDKDRCRACNFCLSTGYNDRGAVTPASDGRTNGEPGAGGAP
jgi:hypothetical protein